MRGVDVEKGGLGNGGGVRRPSSESVGRQVKRREGRRSQGIYRDRK